MNKINSICFYLLVELSTVLPGTQLTMQNKVGIFLNVWAFFKRYT